MKFATVAVIGTTSYDHLKAFEAMGASISYEAESMRIATVAGQRIKRCSYLHGYGQCWSDYQYHVGSSWKATASRTVIENAAREPEIIGVATLYA